MLTRSVLLINRLMTAIRARVEACTTATLDSIDAHMAKLQIDMNSTATGAPMTTTHGTDNRAPSSGHHRTISTNGTSLGDHSRNASFPQYMHADGSQTERTSSSRMSHSTNSSRPQSRGNGVWTSTPRDQPPATPEQKRAMLQRLDERHDGRAAEIVYHHAIASKNAILAAAHAPVPGNTRNRSATTQRSSTIDNRRTKSVTTTDEEEAENNEAPSLNRQQSQGIWVASGGDVANRDDDSDDDHRPITAENLRAMQQERIDVIVQQARRADDIDRYKSVFLTG
jgi:hypothetical protein